MASKDDLDDLLAGALEDFNVSSAPTEHPASALNVPAKSNEQLLASSAEDGPAQPASAAPSTSGASSTCQPADPMQGTSSSGMASAAMPKLPARRPKDLTFDPLKKAGKVNPPAVQDSGGGPPQPWEAPPAPDLKLRPELQKLAADLMSLMEESGLVPGEESGELPDFSTFAAALAGEVPSSGLAAAPAAASTSSASGPEEDKPRSAAVRALLEKTQDTVKVQSKFTRGESSASGQGSQPGPGGDEGGSFPFGDLLGMLGGARGGAEGGGMGMMVDYIMQNLLSKEVLYGPLQEIRDKYPPWLEENREKLSPEDLQRYTAQYASIQAVCRQYEEEPGNFQKLVELIQQMQSHGDPPAAIVDDVAGGMPKGLMGASGDPDDIGNFDFPGGDIGELPKELQDKCPIQ
mmetsp:Transcript_12553/g.27080  ORF Transcript_12553/g.27080 Transcript_12553/m.27080 type:complete len:405 (+) Transcript_12553:117-1331(+)|eukprot:CAMPEP_0202899096 /NCGR_PEP_ID=MMETSP1392-20130828/7423_1 /ASSEMBLY_ACC=CAM_ASM_000868 /TAXON_ID=225041 /ORGANISM="Chlamydomonas chlamydogama, Strain SAG 11-48b" /LENGTH=404 /DNA_ID=CAMNT_0049585193 /DNA_START=114 /DNA_END=1328 /DNA_ORIENTATION=+